MIVGTENGVNIAILIKKTIWNFFLWWKNKKFKKKINNIKKNFLLKQDLIIKIIH